MTRLAPRGIVSLEFAGTSRRAREVVQSWRECAQASGRNVLAEVTGATGRNFGFVVVYMAAFACTTAWAAHVLSRESWGGNWLHGTALMSALGVLILVAGLADILENLFMLRMIAGAFVTDRLPTWTRRMAVLKFAAIAVVVAYAAIGLVAAFWPT